MAPISGALRRAAAPCAAFTRRLCSSPSAPTPSPPATTPFGRLSLTEFHLLMEKMEGVEAAMVTIRERQATAINNFEESAAKAEAMAKETRTIATSLEMGLLTLALITVLATQPEKPSPTRVAAEAANTTAQAANTNALSVKALTEAFAEAKTTATPTEAPVDKKTGAPGGQEDRSPPVDKKTGAPGGQEDRNPPVDKKTGAPVDKKTA